LRSFSNNSIGYLDIVYFPPVFIIIAKVACGGIGSRNDGRQATCIGKGIGKSRRNIASIPCKRNEHYYKKQTYN
jgi:hypothetical protein